MARTKPKKKPAVKKTTAKTSTSGDGFECVPLAVTFLADEVVEYDDFEKYRKSFDLWASNPIDGVSVGHFTGFMRSYFNKPYVKPIRLFGNDPKRTIPSLNNHIARCALKSQKFFVFGYTKQRIDDNVKMPKEYYFHCAGVDLEKDLFFDAYHYPDLKGTRGVEKCLQSFKSVICVVRFERVELK